MIPLAVAEVRVVTSFVVFVRGSLEPRWHSVATLWSELWRMAGRGRAVHLRRGAEARWQRVDAEMDTVSNLFDRLQSGPGCRRFAASIGEGDDRVDMEVMDLLPERGQERMSHVCIQFGGDPRPADLVRLAEWSVAHLPLYWGAAGLAFAQVSGPRFIAYGQIAAMAKRWWGVQIQDTSTLQWDALHGMPGVNWLTMLGAEFAAAEGSSIDEIATAASGLASRGVFSRRVGEGLVLAAGAKPQAGDINLDEDLGAYACMSSLLGSMLLEQHSPLAGPFARPEVMDAWLRRLDHPAEWLDCDIAKNND